MFMTNHVIILEMHIITEVLWHELGTGKNVTLLDQCKQQLQKLS
jgi:hypothetical protein